MKEASWLAWLRVTRTTGIIGLGPENSIIPKDNRSCKEITCLTKCPPHSQQGWRKTTSLLQEPELGAAGRETHGQILTHTHTQKSPPNEKRKVNRRQRPVWGREEAPSASGLQGPPRPARHSEQPRPRQGRAQGRRRHPLTRRAGSRSPPPP